MSYKELVAAAYIIVFTILIVSMVVVAVFEPSELDGR